MIRLSRVLLLALATLSGGFGQRDGGQPDTPKSAPLNEIFSGSVTALAPDSITVVRKIPAKADVIRTFSRDAQTKLEGPALKMNARVTVRYRSVGDGQFHALSIIVR